MMEITQEDFELLDLALVMRRNYIETGNVAFGAADAQRCQFDVTLRVLTPAQKRLIVDIERLRERLAAAVMQVRR